MKKTNGLDPGLQKLGDLISKVEVAMLTTVEPDGTLHSRPMRSESMERDGTLLFFTDAGSPKAREVQTHHRVSLTYVGDKADVCVAIAGRAEIVRDNETMKRLWKPLYKTWFPRGLEDPALALLRVHIERAEYWETPSSMVVRVYGTAKALMTGKRFGEEVGEHDRVNLGLR